MLKPEGIWFLNHFVGSQRWKMFEVFTRHSCTGRYCWERVLAMGILSVRPSVHPTCPSVLVARPGTESSPGEIETPGLHHMIA